jgi:hypothetical protein
MNEEQSEKDGEGRALIRAAFRAARAGGKKDWYRMRTSVLKNRLLDLTARRFDEATYGVSSFHEFLSKYEDLIRVDRSVSPPLVFLIEAADADFLEASVDADPLGRVRRDLWNAIVDYSSGTTWVWDTQLHQAVPSNEAGPHAPELPTISPEELDDWREAFLQLQIPGLPEEQQSAVRAWRERRLGTNALPPQLRSMWNAHQKNEVIHRLRAWFQQRSIEPPRDFIAPQPEKIDPAFRLREFVMECVRNMPLDELRGLQLPATAALRARRDR